MAAALNLSRRLYLDDEGKSHPIVAMFDGDGEETTEPARAMSFVARTGSRYIAAAVRDFEQQPSH